MCAEDIQYADEKPQGKLKLRVYPGADCDFDFCEDAGDGYGYEKGEYTVAKIHCDDAKQELCGAEAFEVEIVRCISLFPQDK